MIKNYQLTHKQATLAYNLVYIPSLKYGLPVTSLSFQQIDEIHRYVVDKFLSAMGNDHSMHRSLIYGPTEYGGFGVRHLYTEMPSPGRYGSWNGNYNKHQLHSTFGHNRNTNIYYMGRHILYFNELEINATLEIKDLWLPAPQCQHDEFLVTSFTTMKASPSELVVLNNWRLYYRVLLRSEVCFATRKCIQPYYLEYEHAELPKQSKTNLNWPEQGNPDKISSQIWKRYLQLCFLSETTYCPKAMGTWNIQEILKTSP
jgi:hypothetical protein